MSVCFVCFSASSDSLQFSSEISSLVGLNCSLLHKLDSYWLFKRSATTYLSTKLRNKEFTDGKKTVRADTKDPLSARLAPMSTVNRSVELSIFFQLTGRLGWLKTTQQSNRLTVIKNKTRWPTPNGSWCFVHSTKTHFLPGEALAQT